jgi:carbon-monoxide dehydrogenase iron sulfur subunit
LVEEKAPVSISVRCQHCEDAPCLDFCLTGAIQRDAATGIVTADEAKCIGCWTCVLACPFGAIQRDTERGRVVKCDLCAGKEVPACVSNCPNEALVYCHE